MRGFRWTPAQTGKEGLFRLVQQAHVSYNAEVLTRQKSYRRFVLDFIHSTRYHDNRDAWSKNEHKKNHSTVAELLNRHETLVRKHFQFEPFDESRIADLLNEFYAFDLPQPVGENSREEAEREKNALPDCYIKPVLDNHTIDLIVQLANEVKLFKETLDAADVVSRYTTDTLQAVRSRNNTRLMMLLDTLASHEIIPYNWQAVIAKKRLIISSSGKKYLDQHDMSSTLNRVRETQPGVSEKHFLAVIDKYVKLVKGKQVE